MSIIFSTHPAASQRPRPCLRLRANLRIASAPDGDTLLREGRGAGIVVIVARQSRRPIFAGCAGARAAIRHGAGLDMIPYGCGDAVPACLIRQRARLPMRRPWPSMSSW